VDNPTEIRDWRLVDEWPAGAKPVTRKIQYDDLYRVTQVDHQYAAGDDAWTSPFAAENAGDIDPRRAAPSPHVSFDKRVLRQTFQYDWLGNTSKTTDDANGFYDRSLGTLTNNVGGGKPYQLSAASSEAIASSSSRRGHLTASYDDAGNLTRLAVIRRGSCLPDGSNCSQLFAYDWDEVGRLLEARRWDIDATAAATLTASSPLPSTPPAAHLRHRYDANDTRVIKTAIDESTAQERSTLYIFGSLELRRATDADGAYARTNLTEVPYLMAHGVRLARVVFEPATVPSIDVGKTHVFLELGDRLGSTGLILDKATSELVERSTYHAYGGAESDYRPERWAAFREDYKFTGKEDDVELGLQYFGKRFYAPQVGRWASADPLAVQGPAGDLNVYAYVHGRVLIVVDPVGLDGETCEAACRAPDPKSAAAEQYTLLDRFASWSYDPNYKPAAEGEFKGFSPYVTLHYEDGRTTVFDLRELRNGNLGFEAQAAAWNSPRLTPDGLWRPAVLSQEMAPNLHELAEHIRENVMPWFTIQLEKVGLSVALGEIFGTLGTIKQAVEPPSRPTPRLAPRGNPPGAPATTAGAAVTVKPGKWDYFFGRVSSGEHNKARSLQNVRDLNRLGFDEAAGGKEALLEVFESGKSLPETERLVTKYGVTVTRNVKVGDIGAIDVKYFYPGGNMDAVPEISSIVPKIFKQ